MKRLFPGAVRVGLVSVAAIALSGCEALRKVAPTTVAAYENGGVVSAVDVLTDQIELKCAGIDGAAITIDVTAEAFNAADTVEKARAVRSGFCARAEAINDLKAAAASDGS
ncbi:MAG: hypothetical protein AAGD13_00560 [Pseudomonadota bacterium]